ncbi:MAG TPA: response regulator [Xanthobacteraceae bacterium]|jgi:two-component system response regulator FixJ
MAERIVHIVDDDAAVRRSLERLLDTAGLRTVSYDGPFALLNALPESGCLLLDVRMPRMDGLQLQSQLMQAGVRLPIIVMTGHGDVQIAVRAMKAGAVDFVEKPFDDRRLLEAIEAALARGASSELRRRASERAVEQMALLSPRERQVLDALVRGHASKTIAHDLGISVRTVEVHRARVLDRLGLRRTAEAIRVAVLASLA